MALLNLRVVVLLMICRMLRLNVLEHSTCAQTCTCVSAISMDLSQQFPGLVLSGGQHMPAPLPVGTLDAATCAVK